MTAFRSVLCVVALLLPSVALADSYYNQAPYQAQAASILNQNQLENLVAPIALYPDPLLGQLLAASTYPLELVEARQWLQQYGNLQGSALIDAAKQQNWDPSVQMLVEFPQTVELLNRDIRWTTGLGNAFLTQQADVMAAIQHLRFEARNNGRLINTPQQVVTTEAQKGQYAVEIQPANPQVIYPPVYNPSYIWGPSYAYNTAAAYGYNGYGNGGYGFGSGVDIAGLFSGILNWGGWGWVVGWFTHSLSLASLFFNLLGHGFGGIGGGGYGGAGYGAAAGAGALSLWAHNPAHRMGVPYPAGFAVGRNVAFPVARAGANNATMRTATAYNRPSGDQWQRFGLTAGPERRASASTYPQNSFSQSYRSPQRSMASVPAFPQSSRLPSAQQNFSASARSAEPRFSASNGSNHISTPHYSAPKVSAPHFSAPKVSAPKAPHVSAPKHSGGGHSGKSSHKH